MLLSYYRVVDQQQTQCDRKQIEKAIIPCDRDRELKKDQQSGSNQSEMSRRPYEKWHNNFHDEANSDGKMFEPLGTFVGQPAEHRRQRLRPVVIIKRRKRAPMNGVIDPTPRVIATGQLYHA